METDEAQYLTFDEATAIVPTETARLTRAEATLEKARQEYDQNVNRHPFAQGSDGEGVRRELEARFLPVLIAAEDEAAKLAETSAANLRGVYDATAKAQFALTDAEYQSADSRRAFVREDCQELRYGRLVEAVRASITNDDRPSMYLFARYVPARLSAGEKDGDGAWIDVAADREKAELRRMLRVIDGKLKDPKLGPLHKQASELLGRAHRLRLAATKREMAARRYVWQGDNDVPWDS